MLKKIAHQLQRVKFSIDSRKFLSHNRLLFPVSENTLDTKLPIVLMEVNFMASSHISYSYLANALSQRNKACVVGYIPGKIKGLVKRLLANIELMTNIYPYNIYRSFGVKDIFYATSNKDDKVQINTVYNSILENLKTKKDVEDIVVNNIWIGDLIYDSYLRSFSQPTIDINDKGFLKHLYQSIELFISWSEYFEKNNVCAVSISHNVYLKAIPARIAISKNIPVYQINIHSCYCLNKEHLFSYADFIDFPEQFSNLSRHVRELGLKEAKTRIERRFSGEVGVDMSYSSKSAYSGKIDKRLIKESNKVKVLIATHCFFDSPHSYCNNIFPDFYEWLDFLGGVSNSTDYDWYIKTHPDYLPGTMEVIEGFIKRYPKFNLLPSNSSHHQIIDEGIDVALTVYGTIGFEYAALGIPVINCSVCNPHIAYNFNLHPQNLHQYTSLLSNLHNINLKINLKEVHEYYFMKHILKNENIFFDNYQATLKKIGGYNDQFEPFIYNEWIKEFSLDKYNSVINRIESFIDSKEYCMDYEFVSKR